MNFPVLENNRHPLFLWFRGTGFSNPDKSEKDQSQVKWILIKRSGVDSEWQN